MKKAALTIALFSTVIVATSFSTPETTSYLAVSDSIKIWPAGGTDGGATGKQKKGDYHQGNEESLNSGKHLNFASVNQSVRTDKKVD
ncbi:hypothetical protein BC749_101292 [Flavobacterium araucananum]|jgi:hypothetical protein|uniref:Pectate lyase n=1 Tax=Flavobacterium araucananum TaxID=946678 RepID=A0A227PF42_9FLAO|nr:hypothetical protein [Flavobacterium araucananum]OXG08103.1 hypothetical protein B0A64_07480 [Flavobacterium araucananum]PWK02229.1 hypothetical protein BC749_101292 [Flavobacterium araucananum]